MEVEIEDISGQKLPEALNQLQQGCETMSKIATYCHSAQKKKEYNQIYIQSQNYAKDALTNAAYHVHAVGVHLTRFLALQTDKVEQLDIHIKILTDRLSGLKSSAGLASYVQDDAEMASAPGARNAVIPSTSLPDSSRIVARHIRKPLTPDIFLERPVFNPNAVDVVPVPFANPMTIDDFIMWRENPQSSFRAPSQSSSSTTEGANTLRRKKASKDKEKKGTRRPKKDSAASTPPSGYAPPPPAPDNNDGFLPDNNNSFLPPNISAPPPPI